jgi:ABC-2 type transport system permease protein
MIDAFLFLLSRSFVNRMRARLKRLKQPKYLIGALFGLFYLSWYFLNFLFLRGRRWGPSQFTLDEALVPLIGVSILFLLVASAWIFPRARTALIFTEAEIAFLFPAPVSRRMLIHFKLLRSQIAILFTVLLLTLVTGRFLVDSQAWMRILGWWVILSALSLHFLGASLVRTLLLDRGISNWTRRILVLLLLAALIVVTALWGQRTLPAPGFENAADWKEWRDYGTELLATPPLSYLLYPFRVMLGPYVASTPGEFARAMGPALVLLALHYLWVIRSNVAFEEASLEISRRFAERMAAARQGKVLETKPKKGQRTPFRLSPLGLAPVAFLWKNLIHAQAAFRARTVLFFILPFGFVAGFMAQSGPRGGTLLSATSVVLGMFFLWSLLLGPQLVRCDFRQDLGAMDVLKLYPLRGWQVVAGEILAPTVILSAVQWLLLILIAVVTAMAGARQSWLEFSGSWFVAAALLCPFWNGLTLLIPNAAVLLFPGWFQTRGDAPQGIEVTGQRLLLLFGQLIVIVITIVPAGLAFTLGFLPLHYAGAAFVAPLVGAVAAAVTFAAEIALGVWAVGKLFDRFDLAAEPGG